MCVLKAFANVFECEVTRVSVPVEEYGFGSAQTHISELCAVRVECCWIPCTDYMFCVGRYSFLLTRKFPHLVYICGCMYTRDGSCTEGREVMVSRAGWRARD